MNRTLSLLGFAGLGAVIVVGLAWRASGIRNRHSASSSAGASDLEDEIATLRGEVERLKREPRVVLAGGPAIAPVTGELAREAERPAGGAAEAADAGVPESTTPVDVSTQALDRRLDADRWDHAWGQRVGGAVGGALTKALPGSRVVDVRCGSAFCRVQVAHASAGEQRALAHSLGESAELETERLYRYDRTEGALVTAVYVARPDQRLAVGMQD